ncbi:hypothetical protein Q1695_016418 [Nippostrongylus brasiliensis]|nr:hypothetical protein Q1695_016418 [Nippostrongylus brasiliensis]
MRPAVDEVATSGRSSIPKKNPRPKPTRNFLSLFTLERFKKNPDLYKNRVASNVDEQLENAETAKKVMRSLRLDLYRQGRQLGFLNIKIHTLYERICFTRQLRQNPAKVLGTFDPFATKSSEDAVMVAPPFLKNALRLHQIRWRRAIAGTRWQKDVAKAEEELKNMQEHYEGVGRDLELKKLQLEMFKRIHLIRHEFADLNEPDKLKKVQSFLGINDSRSGLVEDDISSKKRSLSQGSITSLSSDETNWDMLFSASSTNQSTDPNQGNQ